MMTKSKAMHAAARVTSMAIAKMKNDIAQHTIKVYSSVNFDYDPDEDVLKTSLNRLAKELSPFDMLYEHHNIPYHKETIGITSVETFRTVVFHFVTEDFNSIHCAADGNENIKTRVRIYGK